MSDGRGETGASDDPLACSRLVVADDPYDHASIRPALPPRAHVPARVVVPVAPVTIYPSDDDK